MGGTFPSRGYEVLRSYVVRSAMQRYTVPPLRSENVIHEYGFVSLTYNKHELYFCL